jgi:hypothetical protein
VARKRARRGQRLIKKKKLSFSTAAKYFSAAAARFHGQKLMQHGFTPLCPNQSRALLLLLVANTALLHLWQLLLKNPSAFKSESSLVMLADVYSSSTGNLLSP